VPVLRIRSKVCAQSSLFDYLVGAGEQRGRDRDEKLIANVERAMQAEPVIDAKGVPTGQYVYNGNVANRALELLGKELSMFVDRKEIGKPGAFDQLDDDELERTIEALRVEVIEYEQALSPPKEAKRAAKRHRGPALRFDRPHPPAAQHFR
jgi:hypothetical protein